MITVKMIEMGHVWREHDRLHIEGIHELVH